MKDHLKDAELIALFLGLKIDYRDFDVESNYIHRIKFLHKDFKHFKISMRSDKNMFVFNAFCYGYVGNIGLTCKASKNRNHKSIANDVQKKIIDKIPEYEKKYIDYLKKVKEGIEEKKIKDNLIIKSIGDENLKKYNGKFFAKKNNCHFTIEDHYNDGNYKLTFDSLTIEQLLKIITVL